MREFLHLFGRFLRQPRTVGAIAPSSQFLAAEMVRGLSGENQRVVELGPGTGAFTGALLKEIGPTSRLLAIELQPDFVKKIQGKWPAADCVCASAASLESLARERGLVPVDHVISGLPFASLPREVTAEILHALERVLKPGGTFRAFQYVHSYPLPPAIAFRREVSARLAASPEKRLVVRNLPPAWVLQWTRGPAR